MNQRILWLCLPLALGVASPSFAQDDTDALRYSRTQFGGSARTLGIGGANVALGADYGNVSSNPAGLGLYQKSEVQLTLGVGIGQGEGMLVNPNPGTTLNQTTTALSQAANSFHISGGAVFSSRRSRLGYNTTESNWKGGAFAIGFTRLADFNTGSNYSGTLADSRSLFQRLREPRTTLTGSGNGSVIDQYNSNTYLNLDGLAYGASLTDVQVGANGQPTLVTQRRVDPIKQGEQVLNSGSMSQLDLAYGGSYRDRLYVGLGLGITTSNFHSQRTFTESDNSTSTPLNNYSLYDDVRTSGTGFNARMGLIYRAADAVRIGASVQTPTWLYLTDTYSSSVTANFDAVPAMPATPTTPATPAFPASTEQTSTGTNQYAYRITTPFRANGGVAVTIGKYGFVTGDIEYVGYQHMRLDSDPGNALGDNASFATDNANISQTYGNAINLRFGGEARLDIFRVRLGFAHYGSPYSSAAVKSAYTNLAQNFYTAGLGLRQGNFFLDVAGVYTNYNSYYNPYQLNNYSEPVVQVKNTRFTTTVTAGLTF